MTLPIYIAWAVSMAVAIDLLTEILASVLRRIDRERITGCYTNSLSRLSRET